MGAADRTKIADAASVERGDLSALIAPASIAFIGASERANAPATRGLRHCLRLGFAGELFAVNPKHGSLFGVPCFPSVDALPHPVDLAVIALPAAGTLQAVAECQRQGVRAVVICSSGWNESGEVGQERGRTLQSLLASSPMRVLGPNCIGVGAAGASFCVAYNSSFEHFAFRYRRPVGVVCQSGAMLGGLLLNGEEVGAGVEAFIHVGNASDISIEDAGRFLLQRPEIAALAMMIEGLSDGRAFAALAREARALHKRIAVFKAGASEVGRQAVRSHTGALAGSDELFDAVCRDEGIVRVAEPEDLLQVARVLCEKRATNGRRVLIYTLSGGGASVLADELCAQSLEVPNLSEGTAQACDALGDAFIRAANPFDVGSSVFSNPNAAGEALKIAAADPNIDAVAWIGVGAPRDERSTLLLGAALDALADCGKPALVLPLSGTAVEPGFARAHELGIPVARSVRSAALLLRHALHAAPSSLDVIEPTGLHTAAGRAIEAAPSLIMNEAEARREIAHAGVPMVSTVFASDMSALQAAAADATYPAALKGIAPGVAHKTEAGLVALRLANAHAVCAAAASMAHHHAGTLDGYTLEPMLEGGIETVMGVRIDPQFGAMLMFGLGGTAVELFHDVAFTQCPCTLDSARRLVEGTRASTLLRGFRGSPPADLDALLSALITLSKYAFAHAEHLLEMEINPFIVLPRGRGAYGVDALIIKRPQEAC
ncbi:MAG: acetate--CoA ligase family protein [Proteobacteria bacterium]|nr:acetate--CoA ligase family protein [Pseudomonadota bacterium]